MSAPNKFGSNRIKAQIAMLIGPTGEPVGPGNPSQAVLYVNGEPVSVSNPLPITGGGGGGINWVTPPATATSSGTAGQVAYDDSYFYVCTATNVWNRTPLSSW